MHSLARSATVIGAAGLSAALGSHAVLERAAGASLAARAYTEHAHGSVVPMLAVAGLLVAILGTTFVCDARSAARCTVLRSAERLGPSRLLIAGGSIALLATATLCAMEMSESGTALADFNWLGGNAPLGLLLLASCATLATAAIKMLSDARGVALDRAIALLSKIARAIGARPVAASVVRPRREGSFARVPALDVARSTGLRAPPLHPI